MHFKRNLSVCANLASKLKAHLWLKRCSSKFILTSAFICLQSSFLCQHGKKTMKTFTIPLTCFCYYRKHPNRDNKIGREDGSGHLLLASNSTFMTDFMYLGTIHICRNLNKHYYYLISITFVIWQISANCSPFQSLNMLPCHIKLECLKLIY